MPARWATFDCYGTLVDWDGGIRGELARLWGADASARLLARYHELEPVVQAEAYRSYAGVMAETLARVAAAEGLELPEGEEDALARSLPGWPVFPDTRPALEELRARGWRLAILSNSDRSLIEASAEAIGVPLDLVVVAQDVGSYKPAHGHWHRFRELASPAPEVHVHVAASLFHDVAPCIELGIPVVWVDRLGEGPDGRPARTLPGLRALPETLDELAGARA